MYEVEVYNKKTNKSFVRKFNDRNTALKFIIKVKFSKVLIYLGMTDNSYLYD